MASKSSKSTQAERPDELRARRRVNDVPNARRQDRIARGVIAVIRTDDVPADRQRGHSADPVEHGLGRRGASLPISNQDAVSPNDEQADRREARLPNLFVAVDVVGQPDDSREFAEGDATRDGIGGADLSACTFERSERQQKYGEN